MKKMGTLGWIALILVVIGAINWGLVGVFQYDVIEAIFGDMTTAAKVVYDIVGLAGLYVIVTAAMGKE